MWSSLQATQTAVAAATLALTFVATGCGEAPGSMASGGVEATDSLTRDAAVAADAAAATDAGVGSDALECVSDDQCPNAGACRAGICVDGACAWEPSPDLTPCDDGDACTVGTSCLAGSCGGGTFAPCDDGNPCTVDSCSAVSGCEHAAAPMGGACDDGDPCTHADACRADGLCRGEPLASCACETDADCAAHDDGNLCNGTFACVEGTCTLDPESVITCPAAGPCRTSGCSPLTGQCVPTLLPDGTPCDDQNPCTTGDTCQAGSCAGEPGPCSCTNDDDCLPFAAPGYDLCQGGLRCLGGVCAPDPTTKASCPAAPPGSCTVAACDPATGLCEELAVADGTACNDAGDDDPCADAGVCSLGACVALGSPCDDGDPCTADTCEPGLGCVHTPGPAGPCDDEDPCTTGDQCEDGVCLGKPVPCDDGNACTLDSCDSQSGSCLHTPAPNGTACGETACAEGGVCEDGACQGSASVACPPPGPCATASCVPGQGCVTVPAQEGASCDDGDPCTQPGTCVGGVCQTLPIPCADDNPCTADSCDPTSGVCVHAPLADGLACAPDDLCALAGKCVGGLCATTEPVECPAVPCAKRECSHDTGLCETVEWTDGAPCDAGPCAAEGVCVAGSCAPAVPTVCDDGDPCTKDLCDADLGGCVHEPTGCQADDTSACMTGTCGALGTCEVSVSELCTDDGLVLDEPFPCGAPATWKLAPQGGGLSVTPPGLPPGPFGVGCALGFEASSEPAPGPDGAGDTPELTATRGAFYLPTPPGVGVTLRVRFFEAAAAGLHATRSLRLLDASGAAWAEVSWEGPTSGLNAVAASDGVGGWQERVYEFEGVGPGPWSLQLAVSPSGGGGDGGPPGPMSQAAWWWVDHLIVSVAVP